MKKVFYTLTIMTIFIGVIAVGLNTVFGKDTVTYVTIRQINGVQFYYYDFWSYIENIRNTFTNVAELSLSTPTREWEDLTVSNFGEQLGNNLALILDYIILGLNVLLYPIRIIFYAIQMLLSLVGLPTIQGTYNNNPLKWLIDTTKFFVELQIPYV